ncbi:unnamed protein product [Meganyctiphanes norvegica]|uniref:Uncharacterized protein n=1 Tax=Meganyctiphanes norvegica TaxID=48144 RepID=A0AAV2SJG5_MEGNR
MPKMVSKNHAWSGQEDRECNYTLRTLKIYVNGVQQVHYLQNTIDTNCHGPKCRTAFSVVLPTPGMGFWDHFWHVWDFFFFKILWSITLKIVIVAFSWPLISKGPTKMLNIGFWGLGLF